MRPLAEQPGQAQHQAGPEAGRLAQRGHRPAARLQVAGQHAAAAQRHEMQVEAAAVGAAGELDEQLLLAAHVQAQRHVGDAEAASFRVDEVHHCSAG